MLPISTTNMTGFLATSCGASFLKDSRIAGRRIEGSTSESCFDLGAIQKTLPAPAAKCSTTGRSEIAQKKDRAPTMGTTETSRGQYCLPFHDKVLSAAPCILSFTVGLTLALAT